jgi:hypothetical protein
MCRQSIYLTVLVVLGCVGTLTGGEIIKINFQTAGAPVPEGYLPDTGLVFGDRGNGYSYGWSQDMTGETRDRDNAAAPDQRYDTLIHFRDVGAVWEIELPSDTYRVFIVCGDPSYDDSNNPIVLEGELLAEDPDGLDTYDEYEFIIPVTDGRLTWSEPAGSYVKACFIEIESSLPVVKATKPHPQNGSMHFDTWVTMSWNAGETAVSHDVYMGDDLNTVSDADHTSEAFQGNQVTTEFMAGFPGFAYPDGLVPGTTYYWRVDEVEADGTTIHKGDVWNFSLPPKTAYNPDPADGAEFVGPDNVTMSWTAGYGAKFHTLYLGDDYDEVSNATNGIMVGPTSYKPGPLELEKVYYWRVDEFDAVETHKGDVWTFTTPGAVGNAQPANGADRVAMTTTLSWTPATNATSHELYFGLDKETVRNADASSPEYKGSLALGSESYDPGKLAWHTTYFWRVDELYNTGPVKGPIWSFTTADFIAVDDFESYTDDDVAGEAIWQHWIDGFGIADNGAQVGYLLPPYAEQTIVHGGAQSMPLLYINETGVTNSEATLTLTASRDWTEEGVGALSLWFRGYFYNVADPLYVAVSNAAGTPVIVANENTDAAKAGNWTQWVIPLQTFADQGINLTNVDKIAIGLGSKSGMPVVGGTGTLFIDDIALYR